MKRIIPLILLLLFSATVAQAQLFKKRKKTENTEIGIGKVPVVNGRVVFEKSIKAEGLDAKSIEEIVQTWLAERFVRPVVNGIKIYEIETPNTITAKAEEYIVFRNTFLVLNRSRIYYFLTITYEDGSCNLNMSRITYWWDDEAEDGGRKMMAEECITDEASIDEKGKLRRFNGKFRIKTIELFNILSAQLEERLNQKK